MVENNLIKKSMMRIPDKNDLEKIKSEFKALHD